MSDRKAYFEQARDWAVDARVREARQLRMVWIVAGIATSVALFEALALVFLTPLKTVQPITLLVDRQTGYVQALDPLHPPKLAADAALTQAFVAQYVAGREGYDRVTVGQDYRRVALWSTGTARAQYLALMPTGNPQSPLQRYGSGLSVSVRIKSVSRLSQSAALVRFDTQVQDRAGRAETPRPWISLVRYRYSDAPMSFEDRLVNPLGFQVTGYRRDPEAPPPESEERPSGPVARSAPSAGALVTPSAYRQTIPYARTLSYRGIAADHIPLGSPLLPVAGMSRPASPRASR